MKKFYIVTGIILFIIVASLITHIYRIEKRNKENDKKFTETCLNDSVVHFRNESIIIGFISPYGELSRKGVTLKHIRKGKIMDDIKYKMDSIEYQYNVKGYSVDIYAFPLLKTDSIEIKFKNNERLYLHSFKNEVETVRNNLIIGCYFTSFEANVAGKDVDAVYVIGM